MEFPTRKDSTKGRLMWPPSSRDVQALIARHSGEAVSRRTIRRDAGPRVVVVRKARDAANARRRRREVAAAREAGVAVSVG